MMMLTLIKSPVEHERLMKLLTLPCSKAISAPTLLREGNCACTTWWWEQI